MYRYLPFAALLVFLFGWTTLPPTAVDPTSDQPALATPAAEPDTNDGEARGNIDPAG